MGRRIGWLIVLLLWMGVTERTAAGVRRGTDTALVAQIDTLLQEPGLKGGIQGVIVQSLRDSTVWYERNPDLLFMPASNQKLLTSAAILHALGPDWKYETLLLRTGSLDDEGTLHGNLYLKGTGDPLLATTDLEAFVESLKAAGIKRVMGRVVGDDTRFDRQRYGDGWSWDYLSDYYAAQVSALNLDENRLTLGFDAGKRAGDPVRVTISPTEHYAKLDVRARTVGKGEPSALRVYRELGENTIVVTGTLALDAPPKDHQPTTVTIENPALFAANVFVEKMRDAGIGVSGGASEGVTPRLDTTVAARHTSLPLGEILAKLNKPSDNLVAECLLKTLGAEKGKTGIGSVASGREVAYAWFKTLGMDTDALAMVDGSGLSRLDGVTPRCFATLLRAMTMHPHGRVYRDSLPIAGVDGTLRNRMKGTPAENNCRAKSGYIGRVSSLSGYVTTKEGEPLVFVILMNNHRAANSVAMGVQNRIVTLLAGYEKKSPAP